MSRKRVLIVGAIAVLLSIGLLLLRRRDPASSTASTGGRPETAKATSPAQETSRQTTGGTTEAGRERRPPPAWFGQEGVPARRVAGRVTEGGQPFAGATVQLGSGLAQTGRVPVVTVQSGADGRFDFGAVRAGRYTVTASAKGLTAAVVAVDVRDPRARPPADALELELRSCDRSLSGVVRDSSGGVVAKARVRLAWAGWLAVEADSEGAFQICLPGRAAVAIEADGYGGVYLDLDIVGHVRRDVILIPESIVNGTVVRAEDSTPIEDAAVIFWAQDGGRDRPLGGQAVSDSAGRFRITGLTASRYLAWAESEGRGSNKPIEVMTEAGKTTDGVVIRLDAWSRIEGKVVSAGAPVAGATVSMELKQTSRGGGDALSQEDGSFILSRVPRGEALFVVTPYEVVAPKKIVISEPAHRGVVIEVAATAAIRGRVLRHGKAVAGAEVTCQGGGMFKYRPDLSLADGGYECRGLSLGDYTVRAVDPAGEAFSEAMKLTLARGEIKEGVDLELVNSARISGVVVDENGKPVSGVLVAFDKPGDRGKGWTARDGSYTVGQLAGPGDYTARVSPSETGSAYEPAEPFPKVNVSGPEAHVQGVKLAIRHERLSIAGRVVDGAGQPVADVRVLAEPLESGRPARFPTWLPLASGRSDVEGNFTIEGLARGDHALLARAPDGAEAQAASVAAGTRDLLLTVRLAARLEGTLIGFTTQPVVYAHVLGADNRFRPAQVVGDTFSLNGLPPGRYVVTAQSTTEGDSVEAELKPGAVTRLELKNHGTARVAGRVIDRATRSPVPAMRCRVVMRTGELWGLTNWSGAASSTETDEGGAFELEGVPAGDVLVQCFTMGVLRSSANAAVTLTPGQRLAVELISLARQPGREKLEYGEFGAELDFRRVVPRISDIVPGGQVAKAGFLPGDLVVAVNGAPVAGLSTDAVAMLIADHDPGTKVSVTVQREARTATFTILPPAP